jgi:hypothetical protein
MHLVTSLEQCIDFKTLTVEDLFGPFKAHEERVCVRFGNPVGQHLMLPKKQWDSWSSRRTGSGAETSNSSGKSGAATTHGVVHGIMVRLQRRHLSRCER